jgi:hypothetical protein
MNKLLASTGWHSRDCAKYAALGQPFKLHKLATVVKGPVTPKCSSSKTFALFRMHNNDTGNAMRRIDINAKNSNTAVQVVERKALISIYKQ